MSLATAGAPSRPDFRHLPLGDVGSTNSEALERARAGESSGLWITADRQLGGRGRRGRPWTSEPGNLYASLLLIDPGDRAQLGSLPLAVSIAVHDAIRAVLPDPDKLAIKWPNDVLIAGAKTSGILLESELLPGGRQAVVIGCGINIGHHPGEGNYASTCLAEHGAAVSPQEFFARLFVAMENWLVRWDRGRGIADIREAWLARATGLGKPILVRLPDREIRGLFKGIDPHGQLILEADTGDTHVFAAGDVFFPLGAPAQQVAT